uniref:hypothetical protein n=1 Tax=Drechslerella dactyloides TaxID=74499 RepID=UPI0022FD9979
SEFKLKWSVEPVFVININKIVLDILKSIQAYFGVGNIYFNKKMIVILIQLVPKKNLTDVIITHFEKFPLITQKQVDFLFKSVIAYKL